MEKIKNIIVIGAGLTGLSLAHYLKKSGKDVLILEKTNRTGGVIHTIEENGFVYESGPSTGVVSSVEIAELFETLDKGCLPEVGNRSAKKRYILKNGNWQPLPSGFSSAVKTPLFSFADKLRILGEPFRPAGKNPDESLADMVVRRMGKSFLDYAVDPFISGVYAGDPERLITRYALPKLYRLEQDYGSFIKGTFKNMKQPKTDADKKVTKDVFSAKGGLSRLTDTLAVSVGHENIRLNCRELQVKTVDEGFIVSYTDFEGVRHEILSAFVVSTVGGYALPDLFPFVENRLIATLRDAPYADVIQVAVGYKRWAGILLDGFGGLVPSKEKRQILGVLYPSVIFPHRAPAEGALLSVFIGGSKCPELLQLADNEIRKIILEEIKYTLKTVQTPDLFKIYRHKNAIAQYDINSGIRLQAIDEIEHKYPGLIISGSLKDGIGMADRVKQARQTAEKLLEDGA